MKVDELKSKVEGYRESLRKNAGKMVAFSETGPVGMSVIDALVATIERQERLINELWHKTVSFKGPPD
jgi:hypothetical protein